MICIRCNFRGAGEVSNDIQGNLVISCPDCGQVAEYENIMVR